VRSSPILRSAVQCYAMQYSTIRLSIAQRIIYRESHSIVSHRILSHRISSYLIASHRYTQYAWWPDLVHVSMVIALRSISTWFGLTHSTLVLYHSISCCNVTLHNIISHISDGTSLERTAVYRSPVHARDDMPPSQSAHEWKSDYQRNFTPITFVKEPR
jgi:hypothetical protein